MEVINNMAAAAAKAVWGDAQVAQKPSSEEPVSGRTGDVSKGEPYDAGNIEPQPSADALKTPSTETPAPTATAPPDLPTPPQAAAASPATTVPAAIPKTTPVPKFTPDPTPKPTPQPSAPPAEPASDPNPAAVHPSSGGPGDSTKAQIDVRSPEAPATHPEDPETRARQDVDDRGDSLKESVDPSNLKGPGPRPVAELAKERGGDAGAVDKEVKGSPAPDGDAPVTAASAPGDASKGRDESNGLRQEKAGENGTATEYVKSTGLRADGGNFDAAAAGAGQEAERLLEEKGIRHDSPGTKDEGHDSSDSLDRSSNGSGGPKKHKLLTKLKAKLPHHHKKHEV